MRSYRVSTFTATSVTASRDSQPELMIEQHQQGSFVGLSTTFHTPESTHIPADDQQFSGLRLLAEVSTSQIDPFDALATLRTVTFDDEDQEKSASSLLLPDDPSQVTYDAVPTMVVAKPHETEISEDPKRPSGQNLADQNTDSTDKWIMYSGDETRRFKCGYEGCGKTYITKHDLRRHFLSHIGDSQFRCYSGDCAGAIRYCDKQALARHIHREHTVERPHKCDICNKRFTRSDSLLKHRRNMHSVKDEQNQPQNSDSTDKWIMCSGDKTKPFQCGYEDCGKTYSTKHALRRHLISHIGDSQFRCYYGDCAGTMMVVTERHETGISEDPKRPSGQNLADQNTDSTDKWIMYSGDETRRFKCGYEGCGKTYITKHDLRRHFLSHIGDSQFRCYSGDCAGAIRYCDKQALARHIHLKHTIERPFECDICNRRFTYLHNLIAHRKNVHSVKDEQNQPQNSDSTDKWIMYSGDKTRSFKCGYEGCGKTYTTKYALRRHLILHIGDSQFRCYYKDCAGAMRYFDSQALARHIRRKHTIEKPFKCNICNKRFMRPDYLKHHKKEFHSTEKEQTTKKGKIHHQNERETN